MSITICPHSFQSSNNFVEEKKREILVKDNNLFTNVTTFNTKIIPGFESVLVKASVNLLQELLV